MIGAAMPVPGGERADDGADRAADHCAVAAVGILADERAQSAAGERARRHVAGLRSADGKEPQGKQKDDAETVFHDALLF
jgi:hypothetical protein